MEQKINNDFSSINNKEIYLIFTPFKLNNEKLTYLEFYDGSKCVKIKIHILTPIPYLIDDENIFVYLIISRRKLKYLQPIKFVEVEKNITFALYHGLGLNKYAVIIYLYKNFKKCDPPFKIKMHQHNIIQYLERQLKLLKILF